MITIYPAIFHRENNTYWVEFPDLEGCQTYGQTLEEAMSLAQEALGLYLSTLEENRKIPNHPSDIKAIATDDSSFTSFVGCNVEHYRRKNKAIKKTLSIPQWLNEEAEKRHINFSSVLQDALKKELEHTNK